MVLCLPSLRGPDCRFASSRNLRAILKPFLQEAEVKALVVKQSLGLDFAMFPGSKKTLKDIDAKPCVTHSSLSAAASYDVLILVIQSAAASPARLKYGHTVLPSMNLPFQDCDSGSTNHIVQAED